MKLTTKRQANGTYSFIIDGTEETTEATTSYGARVQGLLMVAWLERFAKRTRAGYQPTDVTLEG